MNIKEQLQTYFTRILEAQTKEEGLQAQQEAFSFLDSLTPEQQQQYSSDILDFAEQKVDFIGEGINVLKEEAEIKYGGKIYPLTEWLTVSRYQKAYGIDNIQTVYNWIKRGIIPEEDVVIIPELNDLKLIRNKRYPSGLAA
ncbi:hypothetical protein BWI97_07295 [Siphonobacter sp. BAB-5405]|uniref:hypothetical protein n=1 Tax=Siphonobacter sp. BAB-5405 TaxID=1864825 RepID=UPI000C7FB2AB|nr:hypothetical protein [Siphonobacter sp. BAB-5405]PMD97428.1 hypothetical protein BWI97_07295 [Siphonobacter sp. BAB-5405]